MSRNISESLHLATAQAVRQARIEIRWKPGKDVEHLQKRIQFQQLAPETTLADYEAMIKLLLHDLDALLYLYFYNDSPYPVVIADWHEQRWAVIINMNGILDTAFLLLKPQQYIERRGLVYLGRLQEVNL